MNDKQRQLDFPSTNRNDFHIPQYPTAHSIDCISFPLVTANPKGSKLKETEDEEGRCEWAF